MKKLPGLSRFEVGLEEARQLGLPRIMGMIEYWLIKLALKKALGNKAAAARMLKLQRTTFVMKCQKYGFPMARSKEETH